MKFVETPGQEHRECYFVELHSVPKRIAVDPEVLRKSAVLFLTGGEVNQGAKGRRRISCREQPHRALGHVAGPDEVIAALPVLVVPGISPWNRERGDEGAAVELVFVREQQI